MLFVVVDSNVYVSALVFGGTPAPILQLGMAGAFQLVVSETIQAEVEETLIRKFRWEADRVAEVSSELWRNAQRVNPTEPVKASRDPDDDHVLACAIEAHAPLILTGDRDLLALHPFRDVEILSPADFFARLH